MADFASSLPVRTELPGDIDIFISDATTPAQKLTVEADGSINVNADLVSGAKVIITDGTDDLAINNDGSLNAVVTATDLDIRDLSAASDAVTAWLVDEAGAAFSSSNPLPVEFFETATEAFDYHTGASIAKNASTTHTFAAPAGFKLKEVYVSGSGKLKASVSVGASVLAVGFNSTANPQVAWSFQKGINASSVNIVVTVTNLDNSAQDLYSTVVGIS